jgi:hypothetical protein
MKKVNLLLLLTPLITFGYSAFSISGDVFDHSLGLRSDYCSVRERGMGRSGSALFDTINYSASNPASLGLADFTVLSTTYSPMFVRATDASSQSWSFGQDFPRVEMVVPMGSYGVLSGTFIREATSDFNIGYTDVDGYGIRRTGSGGVWSGRIGYAGNHNKRLTYGLSLGSIHGKIFSGRFISSMPDSTAPLTPSRYQKTEYAGFLASAGIALNSSNLSLALSATLPVGNAEASATRQTIQYWSGSSSSDSTVQVQTVNYDCDVVAPTVRLGCALRPTRKTALTADGEVVLNDDSYGTLEYSGGIGLELRFTESRDFLSYARNIPVRFGAFYHKLGTKIDASEAGLTFGFSLPTLGHYGYLNIAVEGYRRFEKSITSGNYLEDTGRLSVQYVHKGRWGRLRRAQTGDIQ